MQRICDVSHERCGDCTSDNGQTMSDDLGFVYSPMGIPRTLACLDDLSTRSNPWSRAASVFGPHLPSEAS
jgi:hypothetical protein